jgi:hypothetical protein
MSQEAIAWKFKTLRQDMDERLQRLWAAAEAEALGWGGVSLVAKATGMSRTTITAGQSELSERRGSIPVVDPGSRRVRRVGGGRKTLTTNDPGLLEALDALVEPTTRGDPMTPLRWTCLSVRALALELGRQGRKLSPQKVADLLHDMGYSLQSNRKVVEGASHPDRDAQFLHISRTVKEFQSRGQPVISVDTKKKEMIGNFKNAGREWRPKGNPIEVEDHDFLKEELGKAIPYGVYDLANNNAWVNVGIDHDTPEFAVASIQRWWTEMGKIHYPNATELLITADGGGSNGYRSRMWKVALQGLSDATGLRISASHFPPGTSKWNRIEHSLFCHITQNWRGRPLVSREVVVSLIAATTTAKGLTVNAALDLGTYPTGMKVTDEDLARVNLEKAEFHGEWNYTIKPGLREQP